MGCPLLKNKTTKKYFSCLLFLTATPIEVKSSKNYTTSSLGTFKELFKKRIDKQIIVHPKGYSEADGVIKVPPYMMHLI